MHDLVLGSVGFTPIISTMMRDAEGEETSTKIPPCWGRSETGMRAAQQDKARALALFLDRLLWRFENAA